jgi:hypothetical protein
MSRPAARWAASSLRQPQLALTLWCQQFSLLARIDGRPGSAYFSLASHPADGRRRRLRRGIVMAPVLIVQSMLVAKSVTR